MSASVAVARGFPNEAASIVAAKADRAAFADLYDAYFASVYTYIRYRLPDQVQADDVTAQIFEKVLASLDRYEADQGEFASWLFTVARNTVTDHLRRGRRRRWLSLDSLTDQASATPQPEESAIQGEEQEALLQALARLSARERDLLALKFAAQLTNRRIATLTGLSESNVGVILYRALKRLRTELQTESQIDE